MDIHFYIVIYLLNNFPSKVVPDLRTIVSADTGIVSKRIIKIIGSIRAISPFLILIQNLQFVIHQRIRLFLSEYSSGLWLLVAFHLSFHYNRRALAAADAQGYQPCIEIMALHMFEHGEDQARSGCPHWMSEGNGPAVDV